MPTGDASAPRPSNRQIGNIGERLARAHLEAKGLSIVETNYRCRWGEIDIVARDGPAWAFVEVRTRRSDSHGSPEESITPLKSQHLILAAQDYLDRRSLSGGNVEWRIDLVAVELGPGRRVLDIRHLENAVSE